MICNPFVAVPVLLSLTEDKALQEKRKIGLMAALAVGLILILMTWFGETLLKLLDVRVASFQVTGGLILLLLALTLLGSISGSHQKTNSSAKSIVVVPLAIPLMAGPGAISASIVAASLNPDVTSKFGLSAAALGVASITALLLYFATSIEKFLGDTGLSIVTKVGGLALAAIAIETMAKGISGLFLG